MTEVYNIWVCVRGRVTDSYKASSQKDAEKIKAELEMKCKERGVVISKDTDDSGKFETILRYDFTKASIIIQKWYVDL